MRLCGAFKCGTAVLFYVVYFLLSVKYATGGNPYSNPSRQNLSKSDDFHFFYQGVKGTPGVDFPVYSHIPRTLFTCQGLESGYYADTDTDCQVFHICEDEKKISFLCPNGTIFQQSDLICEWWFKVNCSHSPFLYEESAENLREDNARRKLNRRVQLYNGEKNSNQLKKNSSVDRKLFNKEPNQNNEFKNKTFNARNNNVGNHKVNSRNSNKIITSSEQQTAAHQKTRRYNENDLGNFENNDVFPTSTVASTKKKYFVNLRSTQKEYHVEFPLTAPDYENEESPTRKNTNLSQISDESQVPEETAAFVKNSLNTIHETSSYNPFPNHRTTYSDLKTIPYTYPKIHSTISSVTPQYITTQPINNGKPFLGNRVGGKIKSTKDPLFVNPLIMNNTKIDKALDTDQVFKVHVITNVEKNSTNSSLVTPKVLEKILFAKIKPIEETTDLTTTILPTTTVSTTEATTKNNPTKKQVKTTSEPFKIRSRLESSTTRPRTKDYAIVYGSYPSTTPRSLPSNAVQVKFNKTATKIGIQLGKSFGSSRPKPIISVVKPIDKIAVDEEEILERQSTGTTPLLRNKQSFYTTSEPFSDNRIYNITIRSTTQQPRPFQKVSFATLTSSSTTSSYDPENYERYKISTAGPFKPFNSPEPTSPTPFVVPTTIIDEHVDNMIDVLTALSKEREISFENSRPGLVVPPSVGPQTLHTLSVYFANALDEVIAQKAKTSNKHQEKLMMDNKEKLTTLLTQMTVHGYNQLFYKKSPPDNTNNNEKNVTKKEDFKLESPQIRQLAKNFTLALSAYLNDPEMFRKDLENYRPTEPPETTTEIAGIDEELLNYSDTDTKTNLPPIFTTSQSPLPTWGFILADVDNVINSDLNTADTQSFLPGLNDIKREKARTASFKDLPKDHWTTSTTATNLWKNTFAVDPSLLNDEFDSTLSFDGSTEVENTTPENIQLEEINYELHKLPNVTINSSEVSGILINFMNNTGSNNKLHRILKKLNTTENEFLIKMREIESNPITRRLILLLISECGKNITKDIKDDNYDSLKTLESTETNPMSTSQQAIRSSHNSFSPFLGPTINEEDQDTRALQLLNTLYTIASKLGK
ncbi:uncharacterized protein LOC130896232 isoform X1 [Diorhabda carinulata]|uniref:uncharacterized protein LOC130896232 isoform X1 n=1 Tax=Diorhabda carinulata TaxID=1163345 RepID=UPI0025A2D729|nr:uncharacterized protein LOC130896232 isoform X1 [Diorhabda carinulata]